MQIRTILMSATVLINLSGCTSMNSVMPHQGPTMEQVYDSMGQEKTCCAPVAMCNTSYVANDDELTSIRKQVHMVNTASTQSLNDSVSLRDTEYEFKKVPNPELKLYVYPHFAGNEELPVPGYSTVFNAFDHDHYEIGQG